ncbi:acyl-CoA/acyl-ACP dehydrogenase [Mycolicibacterium sp. S2-37]|uniref:acyl-CoA dehydrogenase family protein n=1 Tax=Mycolicibacterium sp. S2-37 TaxID=2810297 RepID=UPI001A93D390|nr:acyl-CoA dehydrogenase family protein [Mycolicibacterium sp. S2-37]MBO0676690.1 acyl-CoA/acyl-ACP dehydrogenase [Mycolicibacterium sp. S2-37]
MIDAVFSEYRERKGTAKRGELDLALWRRLDELGLVRLTGPEEAGGSGAGWYEAAELLTAAVRHGVRIPLAEHDLLAGWLCHSVGRHADTAVRTLCLPDTHGVARGVPWASAVERIVVVWHSGQTYRVADIDAAAARITPGANAAGEPRDRVGIDVATLDGHAVDTATITQLHLKAALIRSLQVCGALDRIVEMSVAHTASREQFGRPLAKFQAVQNLVADIAAEAALARAATRAALRIAVDSDWRAADLGFRVAVARSCAGHAAAVVVRNAHQVHGAIGTTREHRLHEFTRAALGWRSEFGSVRYWDEQVTDAALQAGSAGLWSLITD